MVKKTHRKKIRVGKNKTVKKTKGGVEGGMNTIFSFSPLKPVSERTFFITKDEDIRDELIKLGIEPSTAYKDNRKKLLYFIQGKNHCRGIELLNSQIEEGIVDEDSTVIYIHYGYQVSGFLIFHLADTQIVLDNICVPDKVEGGNGTFLIKLLKQLSDNIQKKINLISDNEDSDKFYEKNSFERIREDSSFYTYIPKSKSPSKGGKYKKKQTKRKQKN